MSHENRPVSSASTPSAASVIQVTDQLWQRIVLIIAGFLVFLLLASVFMPDTSSGDLQPATPDQPMVTPDQSADEPGSGDHRTPPIEAIGDVASARTPLICTIESRSYRIDVFASESGPRYTVYGRADEASAPLASMISRSELTAGFPELRDMTTALGMETEPGSGTKQLMMVDPNRHH